MKVRDSQRQRVYTAERVLSNYSTKFSSFDETAKYTRKVLSSKWLLKNFSQAKNIQKHGAILELGGMQRQRSFAFYGSRKIVFADSGLNQKTVLHEVAHLLVSDFTVAGHGREYVRCYMQLVKHFMGHDAFIALRNSFKELGVKYSKLKKRKNKVTSEQREILQQRIAKARAIRMENLVQKQAVTA